MATVFDLTIEEIEYLISTTPATSACARAQIEHLQSILATKREQYEQSKQSLGDN